MTHGGHHQYPPEWTKGDWLVPVHQGRVVIKHGHTDPNDHSRCGPNVFCCLRAVKVFTDAYPNSPEHASEWRLLSGKEIAGWLGGDRKSIYFTFCDPDSSTDALSIGLRDEAAKEVLEGEVDLEEFAEEASRIQEPEDRWLLDQVKKQIPS
jgi:hypothetical protein